jgi:uncharacterized membrane protein YccC
MATCPRCHGALSEGHKCRPLWIRRLWRQIGFTIFGSIAGAVIHLLVMPESVPVLGFVLGGLLFFGVHEAFRNE